MERFLEGQNQRRNGSQDENSALCAADVFPAQSEIQTRSIGTATMLSDGSIVLRLRMTAPGLRAEGPPLEYKSNHADYATLLKHLGPVSPGQTVPLRPFADQCDER